MLNLKIDNWLITDDGIKWLGDNGGELLIPKEELTSFGAAERSEVFDWLIHLPQKTWITDEDTYSLNTAYLMALTVFGYSSESIYSSYFKTIFLQQTEK